MVEKKEIKYQKRKEKLKKNKLYNLIYNIYNL